MSGKQATPSIHMLKTKKRHLEDKVVSDQTDSHSLRSNASSQTASSVIMRRLGNAVGHYVASPVVESMDLNAILNEIDWNEVLDKIDINEVIFDKIDVNRLLDRVDVNRHLERVDVNQHLDKVDWDAIIERSNFEQIVSRSTTGVLTGFTSLLRTRLAWFDQWGQRLCRCSYCSCTTTTTSRTTDKVDFLPPRPGRSEDSRTVWENPRKLDKQDFERFVQFRACGATSRLLSLWLDWIFVSTAFAIMAAIISELIEVFTNDPDYLSSLDYWFETLLFCLALVLYWLLMVGCFGRTFGMWILGLLMVSKDGNRVGFSRVAYQVILLPPNVLFFGWVLGYARRDGAFASDILGGVSVVYAWDVQHLPTTRNYRPKMAMSLRDFVETLPRDEKQSLLAVPSNLNVQLGGDDYDGDDASLDSNGAIGGDNRDDSNNGDIELTNLEDGASRWSKDNI